MQEASIQVGEAASRTLLDGVAATLRKLEREAAGFQPSELSMAGAERRLVSFHRALARALQQAHLETVQELSSS